jgi:hypothetical protein
MRTLLLALLASAIGCGDNRGQGCGCPAVDDPVCGSDQITYASACNAQCAGVNILHGGSCAIDAGGCSSCPPVTDPVCGVDGNTYTNACRATCAGTAIAHAGSCGQVDGGATGACQSDTDCVFRPMSGCCGSCLAKTDPVPPQLQCGIACPDGTPSCLCVNNHCSEGTLQANAPCDPNRDLCAPFLKCCLLGGGPAPPDGGMINQSYACQRTLSTGSGVICPPQP